VHGGRGGGGLAEPPQQQQQQQQPPAPAPQQQQPPPQPAPEAAPQQPPLQRRAREDAHTVFVQGVRYTKLECVGRGGSSKVFKVMGPSCKIFALKRIRLQGRDAEAAAGFIDEIELLQRLKGKPNIIQLVDAQVFADEGLVYMVQEYGEIDLARLLAKHEANRRQAVAAAGGSGGSGGAAADGGGGGGIDENFIRLYWQQMLQAVATVHELRIVHSDLKVRFEGGRLVSTGGVGGACCLCVLTNGGAFATPNQQKHTPTTLTAPTSNSPPTTCWSRAP
jgi:serine/threonine-protein kinase TTK/MPS1